MSVWSRVSFLNCILLFQYINLQKCLFENNIFTNFSKFLPVYFQKPLLYIRTLKTVTTLSALSSFFLLFCQFYEALLGWLLWIWDFFFCQFNNENMVLWFIFYCLGTCRWQYKNGFRCCVIFQWCLFPFQF